MARIVIVNPRFETSYWGLEYALPFFGAKANLPVGCLALLAALTPPEHEVTLLDENVEPIDFAACAKADIVALTGMVVQRFRMMEIVRELRRRGAFIVIGGPWVTVNEGYFGVLPDVVFIGEAETTWPRFLADWAVGRHQKRYEQDEKTDMSTVPVPRFDLLKMKNYAVGSVQFSRGCPFTCEFCDIIVVFGRRPRIKTSSQVIAELEALLAAGMDTAFIVDDNLIGNKKAIKEILREVITWQRAWNYPMTFVTEASIDLADDPELMQMLVDANVRSVFIGIETPNEAALRETRKLQNIRKGASLIEKVHSVQNVGLEVWCGMILGFDSDDASIFAAQRRFIAQSRIANAMVGMLAAIPKTPLYARLLKEGRVDPDDRPAYGTNVIPLQISREELSAGYVEVMRDLYHPDAYFARLEALYLDQHIEPESAHRRHLRRHPWRLLVQNACWALEAGVVFCRLMRHVGDPELRRAYRHYAWRLIRKRRAPILLQIYALKCAMHYHTHLMIGEMLSRHRIINSF